MIELTRTTQLSVSKKLRNQKAMKVAAPSLAKLANTSAWATVRTAASSAKASPAQIVQRTSRSGSTRPMSASTAGMTTSASHATSAHVPGLPQVRRGLVVDEIDEREAGGRERAARGLVGR